MNIRVITIVTMALCLAVIKGQDKPAAETPHEVFESAIIHVKNLDGDAFNRLVRLLHVFGARTEADDHLRTIVVYGRPADIAQMRHVVDELDRPGSAAALGRNVEMTLTFLRCSTKPSANPEPLPPDIEAAAKQLRAVTQYKDIALWEILPLHLQEGKETNEELRLPRSSSTAGVPEAPWTTASISVRPDAIYEKDQTRYVRFQNMGIQIRMPVYAGPGTVPAWSFNTVSLRTAGDFAQGQKTILGKLSGVEEGSAIFVVVSLKVLD